MPLSKDHKQQSRNKILASAVKLFSRQGFDNVSIKGVMLDAGMTHGAFYAHFKSKNDIYAESIRKASEVSKLKQSNVNGVKGAEFVDYIINAYLSKQHLNKEESPCPLAFLATDVANNDMQVKTVYTEVFGKLSGLLEQELSRSNDIDNEEVILAVTAMMIGGVAVSRALVDPILIDKLLASCRSVAHQLTA